MGAITVIYYIDFDELKTFIHKTQYKDLFSISYGVEGRKDAVHIKKDTTFFSGDYFETFRSVLEDFLKTSQSTELRSLYEEVVKSKGVYYSTKEIFKGCEITLGEDRLGGHWFGLFLGPKELYLLEKYSTDFNGWLIERQKSLDESKRRYLNDFNLQQILDTVKKLKQDRKVKTPAVVIIYVY